MTINLIELKWMTTRIVTQSLYQRELLTVVQLGVTCQQGYSCVIFRWFLCSSQQDEHKQIYIDIKNKEERR